MTRSFLTTACLALSWMLSPDALIMLGNSVGRGGMMFFAPFAIGLIFSALAIYLTNHPVLATSTGNSFTHLATETGLLPAIILTLASRLCLVLLLPTGMLVTAGFTFNETFIYWFPNFAFSFLLLGIILTLHLAGDSIALAAQPFFIGLTICCLLLLCLVGLFNPQELPPNQITPVNEFSLPILPVFTALILFLGYDRQESSPSFDKRSLYIWTIIAGFMLLACWGFVSLKHVPQTTLADSTIPYIISAREVLGQPGRIIMGVAIISGTCGLVNGLFLRAGRSLQQMVDHVFHPSVGSSALRQRIFPVLFSLFIGIFWKAGLAGSENLDIYIYGSLLFWLLMIGMQCFAATRKLQKQQGTSTLYWYLFSALFPIAAILLACLNVHAATLVVFCFAVLCVSSTVSTGLFWYDRKTNDKTIQNSLGEKP